LAEPSVAGVSAVLSAAPGVLDESGAGVLLFVHDANAKTITPQNAKTTILNTIFFICFLLLLFYSGDYNFYTTNHFPIAWFGTNHRYSASDSTDLPMCSNSLPYLSASRRELSTIYFPGVLVR
jgi:hypothetical protein